MPHFKPTLVNITACETGYADASASSAVLQDDEGCDPPRRTGNNDDSTTCPGQ